jgi:uncharacterized RDD family membrane protein YckC
MAERVAASRLATSRRSPSTPDLALRAGLGVRAFSFLLDSLVLFAFTMLFATAAFLDIFFRSDSGKSNPSDAAIWTGVAILVAAVPCWLVFNLILGARRGQTVGQYVLGLRVVREDGRTPGIVRLLIYWLALHPVLFHPLLTLFWGLLAYVSLSLSGSPTLVLGGLFVALLCLAGPIVALITISGDGGRRGLHDRVAGVVVTKLE